MSTIGDWPSPEELDAVERERGQPALQIAMSDRPTKEVKPLETETTLRVIGADGSSLASFFRAAAAIVEIGGDYEITIRRVPKTPIEPTPTPTPTE